MRLTYTGSESFFFLNLLDQSVRRVGSDGKVHWIKDRGSSTVFHVSGLEVSSSGYPETGTITSMDFTAYIGGEVAVIEGIEWDYQTFVSALSAWSAGNAEPMGALFSSDGVIRVNATDGKAFRFASNFEDIMAAITERVRFVGSEYNDNAAGGSRNDVLSGGKGDDTLLGHDGNDKLTGGNGSDSLNGGAGNDTLLGSKGADLLSGQDGEDRLVGGAHEDTLIGGKGNDTLLGGFGPDSLQGNAGRDKLNGGGGSDTLVGNAGGDYLLGAKGNDSLFGSAGADVLSGGRGSDTLLGGSGRDTLAGGAGQDHLSGMGGKDVLFGGSEDDTLYGGGGKDALAGGAGDDYLVGGSGNDTLRGHSGNDLLDGGDGADTFIFSGVGARYSVSNTYWGFGAQGGAYGVDGDDTITHLGDDDFIRIGTRKFTAEQLRDYMSSDANREGAPILVEAGQGSGGTDTVIHYDLYGATDANTAQTSYNYLSSVTIRDFGAATSTGGGELSADNLLSGLDGTFYGFSFSDMAANLMASSGMASSSYGDWNNDGYADLLVTGTTDQDGALIQVIYGGDLSGSISVEEQAAGATGFTVTLDTGDWLDSINFVDAADIDGDGRSDIVFGVSNYNGQGALFSYTGSGNETIVDGTETDLSMALGAGELIGTLGIYGSSVGDVNGDGKDDVLVMDGTRRIDSSAPDGLIGYVITNPSIDSVASVEAGGNGFYLTAGSGLSMTASVDAAGDVNADGLDDMIIAMNVVSDDTETFFVVRGQVGGGEVLLEEGFADNGFQINSSHTFDDRWSWAASGGAQVAGGGDFDNDGFDDVVIGIPYADINGNNSSGAAYVVFGSDSTASVSLDSLGSRGFKVNGTAEEMALGSTVSFAGDVNGDGYDDILLAGSDTGLEEARGIYVIFGNSSGDDVFLADIAAGEGGFVIRPEDDSAEVLIDSVAYAAGDMNGDGYDDIVVTLSDVSSYVIYGGDFG